MQRDQQKRHHHVPEYSGKPKAFYSGCILNIRNGQKREKPVAGVFKIKAARYPLLQRYGAACVVVWAQKDQKFWKKLEA